MPVVLTIVIAKLLLKLSRLLGRGGGSALPGLVAERLDPAIGSKLTRHLTAGSIVVTGTNGKTTTSKMIAAILADADEQLVTNRAGSNLSRGVVSALIEHASWRGRFGPHARGLFEVDEAAMPAVCAMVRPTAIIVLNLFRDQLDRYGELDTTAQLIGKGIAATEAQLYLNADDPLVASMARYAKTGHVTYFGVDDAPTAKLAHDVTADSNNCPVCGRALVYSRTFFGHIGHYRCKEGHFDHPRPAFAAHNVVMNDDSVSCALITPDDTEPLSLELQLPGLYNLYNAVAAASLTIRLGVDPAHVAQSLQHVEAAFGRVEKLSLRGNRTVYLLLVKNPTGFNQVIQTFLLQEKQQNLLICINDNIADGRDVSWLWDVAFEELKPQQHRIAVSGIRAHDMALRFKYAEIPTVAAEPSLKTALNQFVAQLPAGGTGYVIPTYTALLESRRRLGRLTRLKGIWQ